MSHAQTSQVAVGTRLNGRKALVIGGGQDDHGQVNDDLPIGNGRAMAIQCVAEGADVGVVDLSIERAQATVALFPESIASWYGAADASVESELAAAFDEAKRSLGGLDSVVMNVGISGPQWLSQTSAEEWDRVMAVNLRSHFLACKLSLEYVDDGGAVVLVSSMAAYRAGSRSPTYDASKAALSGLVRHAALEGRRRGIRFNVVAPGFIDTPIGRLAASARADRNVGLPFGRQGTAWEVASVVTFLLSADASYMSGQELLVDGGRATT